MEINKKYEKLINEYNSRYQKIDYIYTRYGTMHKKIYNEILYSDFFMYKFNFYYFISKNFRKEYFKIIVIDMINKYIGHCKNEITKIDIHNTGFDIYFETFTGKELFYNEIHYDIRYDNTITDFTDSMCSGFSIKESLIKCVNVNPFLEFIKYEFYKLNLIKKTKRINKYPNCLYNTSPKIIY